MNKFFFVILILLSTTKVLGSDHYEFVKDFLSVNYKLHQATTDFYDQLEGTSDPGQLKAGVQAYVTALMESQNLLSGHTKVESEQIREVATDLRNVLNDLTKNTYGFLNVLSNEDLTAKEIKKIGVDLKNKNNFISGFFREISFGVFTLIVKEKPSAQSDKQFSVLTEEQRNYLINEMTNNFGKSIRKGPQVKSETPYEHSSRMIYEFLNLNWVFEEN